MTTVGEREIHSRQPSKNSSRSALSALFSRLQNLFAVTVWPEEQDNTLNVPDDEDNGLLLMLLFFFHDLVFFFIQEMMTRTDLLLFGNKRVVEPIKSVPTTALDATLGSMTPKSVTLPKRDEGPRFLDTYSETDLRGFFNSFRFATGRYTGKNFNEMFAQLGFTHLIFNIDVSDNFVHRVSLYDTAQCPENLLAQFATTTNHTYLMKEP